MSAISPLCSKADIARSALVLSNSRDHFLPTMRWSWTEMPSGVTIWKVALADLDDIGLR